ncbi:hypothetical protein ACHFCA_47845 (plasmid) [Delftia tsuruhatensis]
MAIPDKNENKNKEWRDTMAGCYLAAEIFIARLGAAAENNKVPGPARKHG